MRLKNLLLALREQGPFKRFIRNFFITGNAWGMFHMAAHEKDGKPKVSYPTKDSATRASISMCKKTGKHFSVYKCIFCDGYHIGKNRDNK